jgi:hypothetical protein
MISGLVEPWLLVAEHVIAARRCALTAAGALNTLPVAVGQLCLVRRPAGCCKAASEAIANCAMRAVLRLSAYVSPAGLSGPGHRWTNRNTRDVHHREIRSIEALSACVFHNLHTHPLTSRLSLPHTNRTCRNFLTASRGLIAFRRRTLSRHDRHGAAVSGSAHQTGERREGPVSKRHRRRQGAQRHANTLSTVALTVAWVRGCLESMAAVAFQLLQVVVNDDNLADVQAEYEGPGEQLA